jgi:hypothetical protein
VIQIDEPQPAIKVNRRSPQSVFAWIVPSFLLLIALMLLGYFYILPMYAEEPAVETNVVDVDPFYYQIETLKEKNIGLMGDLALAQRSAEIDSKAAKELLVTLSEREKEMRELKEELSLLRSMLSPEKTTSGLGVRSFVLHALDKPGRFAFKLMLIRVGDSDPAEVTRGRMIIRAQGSQGGKNKTLDWEAIMVPGSSELKFRFQFFQRLKGTVSFPEGFKPENILVKAEPLEEKHPSFQKVYSWSAILKDGNHYVGKK